MNAGDTLDQTISDYHAALGLFMTGDPEPTKSLYSHGHDVSLANPFGPAVRGWRDAAQTMERAASHYRDGEATGFERIAQFTTAELAYIVEVERYRAKVGGGADITPFALRVTSIFRFEDGRWRVVHRHADPITTAQPATSVISGRGQLEA